MRRSLSILGATGSIGIKAVNFVSSTMSSYDVRMVTAHTNVNALAKIAILLNASHAIVTNEECLPMLSELLSNTSIKVLSGVSSICELIGESEIVLNALPGFSGVLPSFYAIKSRIKVLAIANKESIVCGGTLLINMSKHYGTNIIPVDSEHNSVFQILDGSKRGKDVIDSLTITTSGGPCRNIERKKMFKISVENALNHPVWRMGTKISIDSATMMNKTLEIIEASLLFNIPESKINVLVHPESIIHGMVSYKNGGVIMYASVPDMLCPIIHSLSWPEPHSIDAFQKLKLDSSKFSKLTFYEPNTVAFPALNFARKTLNSSYSHARNIALNAANEVGVKSFLMKKISLPEVVYIVQAVLSVDSYLDEIKKLEDILECNDSARRLAENIVNKRVEFLSSGGYLCGR